MSSSRPADPVDVWTIRRLLEWTTAYFTRKEVHAPRLSAEQLLAHVLKQPRIRLYADFMRVLGEAELSAYRALVQRGAEQEPIAYLTGTVHFFNLEFEVNRSVLIPRPDSETLVENVMQLARHQSGMEAPHVLDLCTGSGCIAIALATHLKNATVVATDIDADALAVAGRNAHRLGTAERITFAQGDLFAALAQTVERRPFHVIVSNPPYIATAQLEALDRSVREYEPLKALDGGLDGMVLHRRILAEAAQRLLPGGQIFLEIAFDQGDLARQVGTDAPGMTDARVLKDIAGNDRVLALRKQS